MTKVKDNTNTETTTVNMTPNEIAKKLVMERNKVLDDFCKAYIAETGIMPSDLELVTREESDGNRFETVYFFRRRNGKKD